ncbi:MAG: TonB-dependent receptor, partial [Balneolaceae bacterium]
IIVLFIFTCLLLTPDQAYAVVKPLSYQTQETEISGTVINAATDEPLAGVNVTVQGKIIGTYTDEDGQFSLIINEEPPLTLVFSTVGFQTREIEINSSQPDLTVSMQEQAIRGGDVVVSASRVEESLLTSPVSVERMDLITIRSTGSSNFYDGIADLKGVQMTTSSLTFKSVNTRGFATLANTRFVQLIDGMDNAAPGLNFPAGNLIGIPEIDVESVELVPGAASALYGPNAFNGILIINSKDPFLHQGLSAMVRTGLTNAEEPGSNPYGEFDLRYARAIDDRFAFKITGSALRAEDWYATDYTDVDRNPINSDVRGPGSPSYDGLNLYGDEIATTINLDNAAGTPQGTLGNIRVARTGYEERDLIDYNTESYKLGAALHYRLSDNLEAIYNYRLGAGTSIYQGGNRYSLNNITLQQHKVELNSSNYFVRAYTSIENAGDSYDSRFAAWNINRAWKSDQDWFTEYTGAYLGQVPGVTAFDHAAARSFADRDRLLPGTDEFEAERDRITGLADLRNGAKFIDKTSMTHLEGNYDFSDLLETVSIQMGGNFRNFDLNSEGTIFNDSQQDININEWGTYLQASKPFIDDKLKLTGSLRYDKNENFEGRFTPRASAVLSVGPNREHNFRTSFQTGFRNPDTQSQYIGLDLGVATLVGGTEDNINSYSVSAPYLDGDGNPQSTTIQGQELYNNSYTTSSVLQFAASEDPADLEVSNVDFIRPEQIRTWEIGYRSLLSDQLNLDLNFYYSTYEDFQANTNVIVPLTGNVADGSGVQDVAEGRTKVFQLYTNADETVTAYGFGIGLNYNFPGGYLLNGNYTYADYDLKEADPDIIPGFNTPKHRYSISFGNRNVIQNLGFNITNRWSDSYRWEASFGNGPIESYNVTDIQLTYRWPALGSVLKAGGANIFNQEYNQAFGAPAIGAQYYFALRFDNLFD